MHFFSHPKKSGKGARPKCSREESSTSEDRSVHSDDRSVKSEESSLPSSECKKISKEAASKPRQGLLKAHSFRLQLIKAPSFKRTSSCKSLKSSPKESVVQKSKLEKIFVRSSSERNVKDAPKCDMQSFARKRTPQALKPATTGPTDRRSSILRDEKMKGTRRAGMAKASSLRDLCDQAEEEYLRMMENSEGSFTLDKKNTSSHPAEATTPMEGDSRSSVESCSFTEDNTKVKRTNSANSLKDLCRRAEEEYLLMMRSSLVSCNADEMERFEYSMSGSTHESTRSGDDSLTTSERDSDDDSSDEESDDEDSDVVESDPIYVETYEFFAPREMRGTYGLRSELMGKNEFVITR